MSWIEWKKELDSIFFIETTQPPIKYPQVMGQYTRPLKGAFVLGCRGRTTPFKQG